jgi:NAD(P)-dependent dehydrogenase (short-subunit alcohol dehydrogenase family)
MKNRILSGKIALATGGSRGIVEVIAKRLAAEGAAMMVDNAPVTRVRALARLITPNQRKVTTDMKTRLERPAASARMFETENDISQKRRAELNTLMNQRLADAVDLQAQMNIFTEVSRGIDKWLWFVEAHSQAAK